MAEPLEAEDQRDHSFKGADMTEARSEHTPADVEEAARRIVERLRKEASLVARMPLSYAGPLLDELIDAADCIENLLSERTRREKEALPAPEVMDTFQDRAGRWCVRLAFGDPAEAVAVVEAFRARASLESHQ